MRRIHKVVAYYAKSVNFRKMCHSEVAQGLSFYSSDSHPLMKQNFTLSTEKSNGSLGTSFSVK